MDNKEPQQAVRTVNFRDQKQTVYEIFSLLQQAEEAGKVSFTYKEIKYTMNRYLQSKSEDRR